MRSPAIARGFAAFLGAFSLLNIAGSFRDSSFDASHWWISFSGVSATLSRSFLVVASLLLLAFAVRPVMSLWRRRITAGSVGVLFLMAILNAAVFFALAGSGSIAAAVPVPLSFLIAAALGLVLWTTLQRKVPRNEGQRLVIGTTILFCAVVFPLSQMVFFGKTDYRREADAAVVFGARAYADGRPSDALADRVRTACQLYLDGTVAKLVFSGGPGDGDVHETESMRRMAIELGVRDSDILLDPEGLNTEATVVNTIKLFEEHGFERVLAVSHAFHLPRIKMAYQRQQFEIYTVPARESYFLRQMPYLMVRETAAWWVYYLRPLNSSRGAVLYGT